jgi:hypothetical protein
MNLAAKMNSAAGTQLSETRLARRALASSVAVFTLTSIHHSYGAYVYDTPWRLHAVMVSGAVTLLMAGLLRLSEFSGAPPRANATTYAFVVVGLLVMFVGFGMFEGGYNHLVKDILYFSNVSPELMRQLYPAGRYELPNDSFFEITGVLQILPGALTGSYLLLLLARVRHRSDSCSCHESSSASSIDVV